MTYSPRIIELVRGAQESRSRTQDLADRLRSGSQSSRCRRAGSLWRPGCGRVASCHLRLNAWSRSWSRLPSRAGARHTPRGRGIHDAVRAKRRAGSRPERVRAGPRVGRRVRQDGDINPGAIRCNGRRGVRRQFVGRSAPIAAALESQSEHPIAAGVVEERGSKETGRCNASRFQGDPGEGRRGDRRRPSVKGGQPRVPHGSPGPVANPRVRERSRREDRGLRARRRSPHRSDRIGRYRPRGIAGGFVRSKGSASRQ